MIDNKILRNDFDLVSSNLAARNYKFDSEAYKQLEQQRKQNQVDTEQLQAKRNQLSSQFGKYKAQGKDKSQDKSKDIAELKAEIDSLKHQLDKTKQEFEQIKHQLKTMLYELPNILDPEVPIGKSEADNQLVRTVGDLPSFDFELKDHIALGEYFGLDLQTAAKITGSRYMTLFGDLAKLHRSLTQFMLDTQIAQGYKEVYVPYIVNSESLYGTGNLPKFGEDLFKLDTENDRYLIPTAEVPVTNIYRDQIVDKKLLPQKFVAHTPCFRSEAGSYGRDVHGIIRQHQFEKVELVQFTTAEQSDQAHQQLTADAENILQKLGLPYRVMLLCSADVGFSSAKTYDLEVWLPSQNCYREISSCSNFKDFQARRMQARYRDSDNHSSSKSQLMHTINGSGLAVGRTLVAILENFQQADASVVIPDALVSYFGKNKLCLNLKE